MRLVLDTNVLVSALLFRGPASRLREYWRTGDVVLLISDATLAELARVLCYPKFRLGLREAESIVASEILPFSVRVEPARAPPACRDSDDDEFLWCARDGRADALMTGDPDLLALAPAWSGVRILSVAQVVAVLGEAGAG